MNGNSCEYIVKQSSEGVVIAKKICLALAYVAFAILLSILNLSFAPAALKPVFFVLIAVAVALVAFITWRFVCVEYEIVISGGELTITIIYGKSVSKRLLSRPISTFSEMGEYDDAAFEEISKLSLQKNYLCVSSLSAPLIYYGIFEDEGERQIVYFDVTEKAAELLNHSNPSAFRASAKRMNKT
jgi:hypothetical protein